MKTAALYVAKDGPYFGLPNVDAWDEARDARNYKGPFPVVAHPPCERWGRYWSGGPSAKVRRKKGDDGGCFDRALWAVRNFGGVLEHPAHSHAWDYYGIPLPEKKGWWIHPWKKFALCEVAQGHYGHPAEKLTWLLVCWKGDKISLPPIIAGRCAGKRRLDEGFHSKEERVRARAAGQAPRPRLSKTQNIHTPIAFRDLLLSIASHASPSHTTRRRNIDE